MPDIIDFFNGQGAATLFEPLSLPEEPLPDCMLLPQAESSDRLHHCEVALRSQNSSKKGAFISLEPLATALKERRQGDMS